MRWFGGAIALWFMILFGISGHLNDDFELKQPTIERIAPPPPPEVKHRVYDWDPTELVVT